MILILTLILNLTVNSNLAFAKDSKEVKNVKKAEAHKHDHGDKSHKHNHEGHKHDKDHKMSAGLKQKTPTSALIKVEGMVCAFCAQGITKNFNKKEEVESTNVNLDKMEVTIKFKKGKSLSEDSIKKVITGAGFQFKGMKNAQ